jgi:very-short-patch-repair endonuclease
VITLFESLPSSDSPFERILHGARQVVDRGEVPEEQSQDAVGIWLAPWRGAPHPLSQIEQRLSALLQSDPELGGLFHFNWTIPTVRESQPRVDLVWLTGKLVIELDGYSDHSTRHAFISDRHRDYELTLSGYTVLRLANDEVTQDYGRAIQKIRDLVRLRRSTMTAER